VSLRAKAAWQARTAAATLARVRITHRVVQASHHTATRRTRHVVRDEVAPLPAELRIGFEFEVRDHEWTALATTDT
jgi:hypothetical protein